MSTSVMRSLVVGHRAPSRAMVESVVAALLLALLAPLLVAISAWILVESRGAITVRRAIAGPDGRVLYVSDFRVWRGLDSDDEYFGVGRSARMSPDTLIGRLLRAGQLFWLPRLVDVVAGRLTMAEALTA